MTEDMNLKNFSVEKTPHRKKEPKNADNIRIGHQIE